VAYYLTEEGASDVLVVEAEELGSGSTGGSFGGVRQQFSTPMEIELSRRGLAFWKTAERRFESPVPWHPNGYLFMTGQPDIMAKLGEAAALQRSMGLTDVQVLDREQIRDVVPWIATPGLLGATYTPNDGKVTPTEGVAALVKAARGRGVRYREHWAVRSLERVDSGWRLIGKEVVEAERVVVCTGYWTSNFLRSFGLELTIRPQALYSAITGPELAGQPVPLTLDLDTGFVVEREAAGLIIAILFENNPRVMGTPECWKSSRSLPAFERHRSRNSTSQGVSSPTSIWAAMDIRTWAGSRTTSGWPPASAGTASCTDRRSRSCWPRRSWAGPIPPWTSHR
jgi:sarcosine oxidase subunit beta